MSRLPAVAAFIILVVVAVFLLAKADVDRSVIEGLFVLGLGCWAGSRVAWGN